MSVIHSAPGYVPSITECGGKGFNLLKVRKKNDT